MPINEPPKVVIVREERPVTITRDATPALEITNDATPGVTLTPETPAHVVISECPVFPPGDFPYVPPISFAFGDAAHIVWTAPVDGTFTIVRLDVLVGFSMAATISVGVMGNVQALMRTTDNNPQVVADYEVAADYAVTQGTGLWLEIHPTGGEIQGSGVLYVEFKPN